MTLAEHIARRAERMAAAELAAIGRPAVWATRPAIPTDGRMAMHFGYIRVAAPIIRSPFVVRALTSQLPAKELGR